MDLPLLLVHEQRLLQRLAAGDEIAEAAKATHYSYDGARCVLKRLRARVGARNREHMILLYLAHGLLYGPTREPDRHAGKHDRKAGRAHPIDRPAIAARYPSIDFDADAWLEVFERRPDVYHALLAAMGRPAVTRRLQRTT